MSQTIHSFTTCGHKLGQQTADTPVIGRRPSSRGAQRRFRRYAENTATTYSSDGPTIRAAWDPSRNVGRVAGGPLYCQTPPFRRKLGTYPFAIADVRFSTHV